MNDKQQGVELMDAKLIEDARIWVAERERIKELARMPSGTWGNSHAEAAKIVRRLAEQPLEGDDL